MNFRRPGGQAYRPTSSNRNAGNPFASKNEPSGSNAGAGSTVRASQQSQSVKDWFDDEDEEGDGRGKRRGAPPGLGIGGEEEEDPIDAFMKEQQGSCHQGKNGALDDSSKAVSSTPGPEKEEDVDPLDAFMVGVQSKVEEEARHTTEA